MEKEDILGALARGYCWPLNSHKVLDPDLAEAMCEEIINLLKRKANILVTAQKLRDYILRSEMAEDVTLPSVQFRDLCLQALGNIEGETG